MENDGCWLQSTKKRKEGGGGEPSPLSWLGGNDGTVCPQDASRIAEQPARGGGSTDGVCRPIKTNNKHREGSFSCD